MEKHDPRVPPWRINGQDFPREGNATEKLKFLLPYAL